MAREEKKQEMNCIKVVLSSGKIILLREMKMKYQNLALEMVGNKAKNNQMLAGSLMIQELIKILIVKIDDKIPKAAELEALDDIFTYKDISQLQTVIGKLIGGEEDAGELETEFVSIGGQ